MGGRRGTNRRCRLLVVRRHPNNRPRPPTPVSRRGRSRRPPREPITQIAIRGRSDGHGRSGRRPGCWSSEARPARVECLSRARRRATGNRTHRKRQQKRPDGSPSPAAFRVRYRTPGGAERSRCFKREGGGNGTLLEPANRPPGASTSRVGARSGQLRRPGRGGSGPWGDALARYTNPEGGAAPGIVISQ